VVERLAFMSRGTRVRNRCGQAGDQARKTRNHKAQNSDHHKDAEEEDEVTH
jgi:hypothetical protein